MRTRTLAAILLASIALCSCFTEAEEDYIRIRDHKDFSCPPPGLEEFVAWGKTGRARRCIIKNGSFVAAEGNIFLTGRYENGVEVGVWRWYDKDGKIIKEIDRAQKQQENKETRSHGNGGN